MSLSRAVVRMARRNCEAGIWSKRTTANVVIPDYIVLRDVRVYIFNPSGHAPVIVKFDAMANGDTLRFAICRRHRGRTGGVALSDY